MGEVIIFVSRKELEALDRFEFLKKEIEYLQAEIKELLDICHSSSETSPSQPK